MKKVTHQLLILIVALFASMAVMADGDVRVLNTSEIYIAPNTITSGFSNSDLSTTLYVSKNTILFIASNEIFTGEIKTIPINVSHKSKRATHSIIPLKRQTTPLTSLENAKLTSIPLKASEIPEFVASCCATFAPSISSKFASVLQLLQSSGCKIISIKDKKNLRNSYFKSARIRNSFLTNALFARPPTPLNFI